MNRHIDPEMVRYIDMKLALNGLAQEALRRRDPRLLFRLAAEACVGITEASGRNDGKMVRLIQETIGRAEGEPWCMALVQTCIAYAEVKCAALSPVAHSEHCQTVWSATSKKQRVKKIPLPGAIAIWADVGKASGHTEIVLACDGVTLQCVGGNTTGTRSPGDPINREGQGCFYTVRSMKSTKKRKLLGFLRPF